MTDTPEHGLPPLKEFRKLVRDSRKGADPYPLFKTFLGRVMKHLGFAKATRVQNDMADYLQFGPSRTIMEAFRGVGKSFVTSAFVVWSLLNNPQLNIMVVSASKERSDSFSLFVKRLIAELPECAHLRPQPWQRDSNISFDVGPAINAQFPSVKSVGIKGQITGSRADIVIADDIETPLNSFTAPMRDRTAELVKEFDNVIKPEEHTRIIYLGTPQTEQSLYNLLQAERQYSCRVWPAEIPKSVSPYKGTLAPMVMAMIERGLRPGTAVDPERFTGEYLRAKQMQLGRSTYTLQFMLDSSLSDGDAYPLKLSDLMVMGLDGEKGPVSLAYGKDPRYLIDDLQPVGFGGDFYYAPMFIDSEFALWQGSILAIDPGGRGQDETAYCVLKSLHGRLFLVASGGMHGGSTDENLKTLAEIAKRHRVNAYTVEVNFGDGMFGQLLKPHMTRTWPCAYEETRAVGQKETRIINTVEPLIQQHRLVVDRRVIEEDLNVSDPCYSLFWQMARITKQPKSLKHDDRLDALEMAVAYFLSQMETDTDTAAKDHAQELLDLALEAFMEGGPLVTQGLSHEFFGGTKKPNWTGGPGYQPGVKPQGGWRG